MIVDFSSVKTFSSSWFLLTGLILLVTVLHYGLCVCVCVWHRYAPAWGLSVLLCCSAADESYSWRGKDSRCDSDCGVESPSCSSEWRRMCALVLRSPSASFHCVSFPPLPVDFMRLLFPPITSDSVSRTDLLFCSVNGPQRFLFQCWTPALCPVCVRLSDVRAHVELLHILDYFGRAVCLLPQVDRWSAAQNHN